MHAFDLMSFQHALLIEDTPINQKLIKMSLIRLGYEVTITNNGVEAVEAFAISTFDIILMEIKMLGIGSIEATEVICSMGKYQSKIRTPIISLTANALKGCRKRYIASEMEVMCLNLSTLIHYVLKSKYAGV